MGLAVRKPVASDTDIDGLPNLCRCGCYVKIEEAVRQCVS